MHVTHHGRHMEPPICSTPPGPASASVLASLYFRTLSVRVNIQVRARILRWPIRRYLHAIVRPAATRRLADMTAVSGHKKS